MHLFGNSDGKMTELDTYAIPEAHDPAFADGFGDLSVHEVATSQTVANRMYFSYYSGGFRVAEIEDDKIVEKGHYIAEGGNNFWGVETFEQGGEGYVAASDHDSGLWIFKCNGRDAGAPDQARLGPHPPDDRRSGRTPLTPGGSCGSRRRVGGDGLQGVAGLPR